MGVRPCSSLQGAKVRGQRSEVNRMQYIVLTPINYTPSAAKYGPLQKLLNMQTNTAKHFSGHVPLYQYITMATARGTLLATS